MTEVGVEAPEGVVPVDVERTLDDVPPALVDLALWLADYYGSTPARALELVAPAMPKRRAERPSPVERDSLAGEAEPTRLTGAQRVAIDRVVASLNERRGHFLLEGPTGSGKTEVYLQAAARGARAGPSGRSCSSRRSLSLRRPSGASMLGSATRSRCSTRRSARPSGATSALRIASRRGPHRRRGPVGGVRTHARRRSDRPRRGARRLVQAGLRPSLRRPYGRRQARRARGSGHRVRERDAAARRAGSDSSGSPSRHGSGRRCRMCGSSTSAGKPATRSRRRCSPSSAGSPSGAAGRSCC